MSLELSEDDFPAGFFEGSWWPRMAAHGLYRVDGRANSRFSRERLKQCAECGSLFVHRARNKRVYCRPACGLKARRKANPEAARQLRLRHRSKPHARRLAVLRQQRYRARKKARA